jgi:hypothetical protein
MQEVANFVDIVLLMVVKVLILIITIIEVKALLLGFKGGNGMYQVDEISKASLIILLYYMVIIEGNKTNVEHMVYPLTLYILLIFAVLMMAKLEKAIEYFIELVKAWKGIKDDLPK